MKKIFILLLMIVSSACAQATDIKDGEHYKTYDKPLSYSDGDKIKVLEFFWYGCPHCYSFEPHINSWKKTKSANVEFVRVPAIFRPDWEIQARTYYALSNMKIIEGIHGKIFDAIHKDRNKLNKLDQMLDFLVNNGVNKEKFMNEYNSFAVDSMVRKAKKKQRLYEITSVPAVAVNGKYLTGGQMAGSYENMIKVLSHLIEKERK